MRCAVSSPLSSAVLRSLGPRAFGRPTGDAAGAGRPDARRAGGTGGGSSGWSGSTTCLVVALLVCVVLALAGSVGVALYRAQSRTSHDATVALRTQLSALAVRYNAAALDSLTHSPSTPPSAEHAHSPFAFRCFP